MKNDIANKLFIMNDVTVERLFILGADCFLLYSFYYKTAKWQNTTEVWATNDYVAKKLGWGEKKVRDTKKILENSGFIKQVRVCDNTGKVTSWNIRLEYIQCETTPSNLQQWSDKTTPSNSPVVVKMQPNNIYNNKISYINNNINNNNNNINNIEKEKIYLYIYKYIKEKESFADFEYLFEILNEWLEYKSLRKQTYKDEKSIMALCKRLHKLCNGNAGIAREIVERSIANNWSGLFELKDKIVSFDFDDEYVIEKWNELAKKLTLPRIDGLQDDRKEKLQKTLNDNKVSIDEFFDIIYRETKMSDKLGGIIRRCIGGEWVAENDATWRPNFDWYINLNTFRKVKEGAYRDSINLMK